MTEVAATGLVAVGTGVAVTGMVVVAKEVGMLRQSDHCSPRSATTC